MRIGAPVLIGPRAPGGLFPPLAGAGEPRGKEDNDGKETQAHAQGL